MLLRLPGPARPPTWKRNTEAEKGRAATQHPRPRSEPPCSGMVSGWELGPGSWAFQAWSAKALPSPPGLDFHSPPGAPGRGASWAGPRASGPPDKAGQRPPSRVPPPSLITARSSSRSGRGEPEARSLGAPTPQPGRGPRTPRPSRPPRPPQPYPNARLLTCEPRLGSTGPGRPRPSSFYWLLGMSPRQQGPPPHGRRGSAQGRGRHFSTLPYRKRERLQANEKLGRCGLLAAAECHRRAPSSLYSKSRVSERA